MLDCSVFTHGGSWASSRRAASVLGRLTLYSWCTLTIGAQLDHFPMCRYGFFYTSQMGYKLAYYIITVIES